MTAFGQGQPGETGTIPLNMKGPPMLLQTTDHIRESTQAAVAQCSTLGLTARQIAWLYGVSPASISQARSRGQYPTTAHFYLTSKAILEGIAVLPQAEIRRIILLPKSRAVATLWQALIEHGAVFSEAYLGGAPR